MYKNSRTIGFGDEVKRRIMLGTFVLSEGYYDDYYLKALKVRNLIKKEWDEALEKYDMILAPVAPTTAPKIDGGVEKLNEDELNRDEHKSLDILKMYMSDVYTVAANLCGLPAISVPCGDKCNFNIEYNSFKESSGNANVYVDKIKDETHNSEINMPVGVQFIGKAFDDYKLMELAAAYEILRGEGE